MGIKTPQTKHLTFAELQERWQWSENDLRSAIISEEVKPSIWLTGMIACQAVEQSPSGDWIASTPDPDEVGTSGPACTGLYGWFYLQEPHQTASFDCEFKSASEHRNPQKEDRPHDWWYVLPNVLTLENVKTDAIFLMDEISRYETNHSADATDSELDDPLRPRVRETLLKLIIGMAIVGYKYDPADARSSVPKEISDDLVGLGMSVTDDTVRKYLKQAAQKVLPAKLPPS